MIITIDTDTMMKEDEEFSITIEGSEVHIRKIMRDLYSHRATWFSELIIRRDYPENMQREYDHEMPWLLELFKRKRKELSI